MERVLVTGAGGFIGHHLVNFLKAKGYWVRGVDLKQPLYQKSAADEFFVADLRDRQSCDKACAAKIDLVFHLAADMGGIGYISGSHASIARNNTMINLGMLDAANDAKVQRFFFSSTACVYPKHLQTDTNVEPLKESAAHPAAPEEGYGWEKIYTEKLCEYYLEEFGLQTRVARFHNIYGPMGTYDGGREKAPAAVSRKVARAEDGDVVEIWGDGKQTRSFLYVDDCVEGVWRLTLSDYSRPVNLGSEEMVTIDQLYDMICKIAGKKLTKRYDLQKPQGVRGRNSDNTIANTILRWYPNVKLRQGLEETYRWIAEQVKKNSEEAGSGRADVARDVTLAKTL